MLVEHIAAIMNAATSPAQIFAVTRRYFFSSATKIITTAANANHAPRVIDSTRQIKLKTAATIANFFHSGGKNFDCAAKIIIGS